MIKETNAVRFKVRKCLFLQNLKPHVLDVTALCLDDLLKPTIQITPHCSDAGFELLNCVRERWA